ncbi:MAG: pilus assembly protein [Acetobacteraceae bacterium]|nr:pilus assembly protein [Acetobacteraceae bacterium]
MRSILNVLRDRRGSAAMEFALLAPIFGLIAIGAYDFGNAVQTSMRLERAARAGAQFALVHPRNLEGIATAARAAWPSLTSEEVPTPTEVCRCNAEAVSCTSICANGLEWTVTVTATRSISTLMVPGLNSRSGTATVRVR